MIPLSNARPSFTLPEAILRRCGAMAEKNRLNLTEMEEMIKRTLLLCDTAIIEAERTGDNYVSNILKLFIQI